MKRILIVEDQGDLRELIVYNLKRENRYIVTAVENANDALIILEDVNIDLLLLDLMLPGLKGLDFLKIVRANPDYDNLAVIIISAKTKEKSILKGLRLGADDYLPKPFSIALLIAKIDTVLRRTRVQKGAELKYRGILLNENSYKVHIDAAEIQLTRKEFDLLALLLKNPRKVLHRNQLLHSVWGYETDTYTRTVDSHISSLRKKMGVHGKLIQSVPKIGYGLDL